jgi:hypothetical protein
MELAVPMVNPMTSEWRKHFFARSGALRDFFFVPTPALTAYQKRLLTQYKLLFGYLGIGHWHNNLVSVLIAPLFSLSNSLCIVLY